MYKPEFLNIYIKNALATFWIYIYCMFLYYFIYLINLFILLLFLERLGTKGAAFLMRKEIIIIIVLQKSYDFGNIIQYLTLDFYRFRKLCLTLGK